MSINDIKSKIKSFGIDLEHNDLYIVFIVITVAFGSFFLGRFSRDSFEPKPLQIPLSGQNNQAVVVESSKASIPTSKQYVASKKGKKYYPVDCLSAQSIKVENKIYFNSSKEAEQAGYSASTSC